MTDENRRDLPSAEQLGKELRRLRGQERFRRSLMSTVASLIVVAAIAVIVSTMMMPVIRVTGTSMNPTLQNDEVLLCVRTGKIRQGDIIAFHYNNKILLKRVIAVSGDTVDLDEDGTVYLNGEKLEEPYVSELALGECDVQLPYQVPEGRVFVMGDHRAVSIDSRSATVGVIAEENIAGKVLFRVYPFGRFGGV